MSSLVEEQPQLSEQSFLSKAIDFGRTVLDGGYDLFNSTRSAVRSVGAVGLSGGVALLGVGGVAIETPSAFGDSQASGSTVALTEAQCEAEALQQPSNMQGYYQLKNPATNPISHWYVERFTLPSVANCDELGKRVVSYFEEDTRGGGGWTYDLRTIDAGVISSTIVPKINSDKYPAGTTNQAAKVHGLYRAPNFCFDEGVGLRAIDAHGTQDRPAAEITWQPNDGTKAVSQIFHGPASKMCEVRS